MIRQYLSGTINDPKTQGEQKIQLTTTINCISSKKFDETHTMHSDTYISKSNNIKIMIGDKTDEIIEELFESLLERYQEVLR